MNRMIFYNEGDKNMISAVDLRAGMTFIQDGKLIKVLDASHHKPGKGNTVMRMKYAMFVQVRRMRRHFVQTKSLKKHILIQKQFNICTQWMTQVSSWI